MTHALLARRTIYVISFLLTGFLPAARAQEGKATDPAGTWELRFERPGRPPSVSILRLEKAGDKYVGALASEQGQTVPVKEALWKDGELSFRVTLERQGQEFNLDYKGKVTGEAIKGKVSLNILGQNRSFDFEGNRKKDEPTLAGLWNVTLKLESGAKLQPSVRLKKRGNRFTGTYVGVNGKEMPLQELKSTAGEISFRVTEELDGEKTPFRYAGKLAGDRLTGTVEIGEGKHAGKLPFEARRVQTPTANVAGMWRLTVAYQPGVTFQPTLKLAQTGSALSGAYAGEQGETPITNGLVLGDEILFEVARNREGKNYKLKYTGRVAGDIIKGRVNYDFDGMIGALDFEARRADGAPKP